MSILILNKRARYEFHTIESFQAGLSLNGVQIKNIREGKITLRGSFIIFQKNRLQLINVTIGNQERNIYLLLNKKELSKIKEYLSQKGYSCVPINIKRVGRWIKSEIAIVKGKQTFNKRILSKTRI
ncbi:MAG: SsrA-binding protein [Thermales bacterium]|nr:SsrA-binding protein [Thermales bacterium]